MSKKPVEDEPVFEVVGHIDPPPAAPEKKPAKTKPPADRA